LVAVVTAANDGACMDALTSGGSATQAKLE
jgi:hypothetical protein